MAWGKDARTHGLGLAAVALEAKQFFFCKLDASAEVVLAGDGEFGYPQCDAAQLGDLVTVQTDGFSPAQLGGVVAPWNNLAVNADGELIVAAAGKRIVAIAMEDGADGEIRTVKLTDGGLAA